MFPPSDHIYICGYQEFTSEPETNDARSATNSHDIITITLGALATNSYFKYT
jgi:hypothetical protein